MFIVGGGMRVKGKAEICSICALFRADVLIANVIIFAMILRSHRRFLMAPIVAMTVCLPAFALQRSPSEAENLRQ